MRMPRRFDNALMTPPDPLGRRDAALLLLLRSWCEDGAFTVPPEPLRVAGIAPHAGLDGVACELDGSHALARLGRWQGLWWRLRILGRECMTARGAHPGDPWDCGWWREGTLGAWETFQPRRATLLMVRDPAPAAAAALLSTLQARSPSYAKPLRVLIVSAAMGADGPEEVSGVMRCWPLA